jgi:hypothetical protein
MRKKAQSISEYAILIGAVIAAFMSISTYVKRGYQARLKGATDFATQLARSEDGYGAFSQYEPYYLFHNVEANTESNVEESYSSSEIGYNARIDTTRGGTTIFGIDVTQDDGWFE